MAGQLYPEPSPELAHRRRDLAPDTQAAFDAFSRQVFGDGALDTKTKQLIAVAVAHVTQCPYCIQGHTKAAQRAGATAQELMETVGGRRDAGRRSLCSRQPHDRVLVRRSVSNTRFRCSTATLGDHTGSDLVVPPAAGDRHSERSDEHTSSGKQCATEEGL